MSIIDNSLFWKDALSDVTAHLNSVVTAWLNLSERSFSREENITENGIYCDCAGFIRLLCEALKIKLPFNVLRPKAVHYFSVLQEIGSDKITTLKAGHLLAWRKQQLPKSGDTGHVLLVVSEPRLLANNRYSIDVVDATHKQNGLSRRTLELFTKDDLFTIGVKLHEDDTKVKRTAIYHQNLLQTRYCWGCALPNAVCSCDVIKPLPIPPNIIILRHHKERKRTLSTVSLIKQRYPSVLVIDGEQFPKLHLQRPRLLFPSDKATLLESGSESSANSMGTLVVIDATWKKAKKILHLNPWLQALEHVLLKPQTLSDYLLRKIPSQEGLSTLEAYAVAANDRELAHTLAPFMEKHIRHMGAEVYQKNYQQHLNYRQ